jgi:hypothetical protein
VSSGCWALNVCWPVLRAARSFRLKARWLQQHAHAHVESLAPLQALGTDTVISATRCNKLVGSNTLQCSKLHVHMAAPQQWQFTLSPQAFWLQGMNSNTNSSCSYMHRPLTRSALSCVSCSSKLQMPLWLKYSSTRALQAAMPHMLSSLQQPGRATTHCNSTAITVCSAVECMSVMSCTQAAYCAATAGSISCYSRMQQVLLINEVPAVLSYAINGRPC